jgi:hypothetical protein
VPEPEAAKGVGLVLATLVDYRKSGHGPQHTVVGRKIYYHVDLLSEWLAKGGMREAI